MKYVEYINELSLIKKVEVITEKEEKFSLQTNDNKIWFLDEEKVNFERYFLIINESFPILNFKNKFIIENNINFSVINTMYNQSDITIDNLFISEEFLVGKEFIKPKFETNSFNSLNECINITSTFSNVKKDFLLHLEIYTSKRLIGIIPAVITASDKSKGYKRTYACSLDVSNFTGLNDVINLRIKTSFETYITKQFKFSTLQNYSYNKIKKDVKVTTIKG